MAYKNQRSNGARNSGNQRRKSAFKATEPSYEFMVPGTNLKVALWEYTSFEDLRWKASREETSRDGNVYYPSSNPAKTVLDLPALTYSLAVELSEDADVAISDELRSELVVLAEILGETFGLDEDLEEAA